ncbi:MAG: hypothetical protein MZV70_29400, partial [Desulfobacterales bacterium]|nr:hypothetical protein [Desulfobacterales bacterium]
MRSNGKRALAFVQGLCRSIFHLIYTPTLIIGFQVCDIFGPFSRRFSFYQGAEEKLSGIFCINYVIRN